MKPLILHVAHIDITEGSGMGRVAVHWRREFERRGFEFVHIGSQEVGPLRHPSLFPYAAYRWYQRSGRSATIALVHEPASGVFVRKVNPTVVFSHGVERRRWQLLLDGENGSTQKVKLRSRIFHPLSRLRSCESGLRRASRLLLINNEDARFVEQHYGRSRRDILVYKNGVYPCNLD